MSCSIFVQNASLMTTACPFASMTNEEKKSCKKRERKRLSQCLKIAFFKKFKKIVSLEFFKMWLISFQNRILPKKGYFYESMGHIVKSTQMRHFVAIFTHCALSCCSFLKSYFCSRSKTVKSMQMNYRGMKRCSNSTTSVVGHLKRPQKSKSGLLC